MTSPNLTFFIQVLISINLCQHSKNQTFRHFVLDIVDLKILQSDWPGEIWPMSQETDFFKM